MVLYLLSQIHARLLLLLAHGLILEKRANLLRLRYHLTLVEKAAVHLLATCCPQLPLVQQRTGQHVKDVADARGRGCRGCRGGASRGASSGGSSPRLGSGGLGLWIGLGSGLGSGGVPNLRRFGGGAMRPSLRGLLGLLEGLQGLLEGLLEGLQGLWGCVIQANGLTDDLHLLL